jgi:hypothetical protein
MISIPGSKLSLSSPLLAMPISPVLMPVTLSPSSSNRIWSPYIPGKISIPSSPAYSYRANLLLGQQVMANPYYPITLPYPIWLPYMAALSLSMPNLELIGIWLILAESTALHMTPIHPSVVITLNRVTIALPTWSKF